VRCRRTCDISARGADDPWLRDLLAQRPFKVAIVGYAAKMARIIWAMLATLASGNPLLRL